MYATIPPGRTARVISRCQAISFRPERLIISERSFSLPLARRAWTWPLIGIGGVLRRAHRQIAKFFHVDLYAAHERREYVSTEIAQAHADEVEREEGQEDEDGTWQEGRPFIRVQIPRSRRERMLSLLGRAADRLSDVRLDWQRRQLATLIVHDIRIASASQFVEGAAPLPAEMFASTAIDNFLILNACPSGNTIEIEIENTGRRECRLAMSLLGSGLP